MIGEPPSELASLVALAALPGIGPATLHRCLEHGPAEVWGAIASGRAALHPALALTVGRPSREGAPDEIERAARSIRPDDLLDRHLAAGIAVHVHGTPGYPERLVADPAPPALLFVDGSLAALDGPTVAVVGTRNATRLGCDTAAELSRDLARCGVSIVSGLALGIDGAAHRPLVDGSLGASSIASGRPIAVVAAGLDHRYPRRHAGLHDDVHRIGAVVSEVPFGVGPTRWRFPARNRIIAGLADALLVVESRSAGGSMLTVTEALARDVPVLAVPGHPTAAASAGTIDLICDGAVPVRDAEDVLVAIGLGGALASSGGVAADGSTSGPPPVDHDDAAARSVLELLAAGPQTLEAILGSTGRSLSEVSGALVALERTGRVARSGGWYEQRGVARSATTQTRRRS